MISTKGRYALRVMIDLAEQAPGGYRLTRRAEEYSVGEILELTEGTLAPVACLEAGAELCPRKGACKTLPMWTRLDALVHDFFYSITLVDLAEQPPEGPKG